MYHEFLKPTAPPAASGRVVGSAVRSCTSQNQNQNSAGRKEGDVEVEFTVKQQQEKQKLMSAVAAVS